ncbi:MAG: phage terminase large subunit [Nostocoides sp.]
MIITNPLDYMLREWEPRDPGYATPGEMAVALNPKTVQTPALGIIDRALVELANTPDGRLIITMAPQEGKALALDTPVPTPTGWATMGTLRVGDEVIGGDGKPCRVTWVSPVWTGRECYAVTTGDGEQIVADAAHEWVAKLDRRRSTRIVETADLAKPRLKAAQITAPHHGLDLPDADLPLDPYVLGVWLGDGTTGQAAITCHPDDAAIRDRFAEAGWPLRHTGRLHWTMAPDAPNGTWGRGNPTPAKAALRAAGVLTDKHIPPAYLRASRAQRLALLQGLIDSDGYVMPKGQVEFCSVKRQLADDVRELVYSLGAKAVTGVGRATMAGRDCGPKYRVRFYLADAAHLPRKAVHCKDSSVSRVRYVRATPCESVPTVCIEVDSDDHTFLAGRTMLPTHNSVRAATDFPTWLLARRPDTRIIVASYGQTLATRNGRAIRNRIISNPGLGLRIAPDNGAASQWTIDGHTGGVYAVSIGSGVSGWACDAMIIDDPIKSRAEADSETFRQRVWDWWTDEASTRLSPGAPVALILTRWHHDDLAGRLLAEPDSRWKVLNIPAQCDDPETDPLGRKAGEFMLSTRGRTRAQWEIRRAAAGPRAWASLFQGRPTPDQGNMFPADGWARYRIPPWIERDDGARIIPGLHAETDAELIQSWDFTFKDSKGSDFVVGQVWLRRGVHVYILDQVRRRAGFDESRQMMLDLTARWPQAVLKLVEDKANGPAILNSLRAHVGGMVPVEPEGSKYARAAAITPLVVAQNVVLPDPTEVPGTAWVTDLVDEAREFPSATHDDTVDAMSQAVHRLLLVPMMAQSGTLTPEDVYGGDDMRMEWAEGFDY